MTRGTLLVIIAAFVLVGGAVLLAQNAGTKTYGIADDETRIEAPGTRIESDNDKTRIQAPGVDITVPRGKDGD
ncbi:hypothetical protein [Hyphomicrobium sp.]|uniref:hypothetical protein n=1 Tax=Hyphomicrobium sp. TaxID=82 RepID=UPI002E2FA0A7|nr:hypothetical protein [Hyphomicrobium sp.]HEX2841302.1 hypothetical protein [Hyphomicrobium sp.]